MKKMLIACALIVSALGSYLAYHVFRGDLKSTTDQAAMMVYDSKDTENGELDGMRSLISTFYTAAQQDIPLIKAELEKLNAESGQNKDNIIHINGILNLYQLVATIADRDVAAIKVMDAEQLSFTGQLTVEGERLGPDVTSKFSDSEGKEVLFAGAMLGAENALGFVLLNALRDRTVEDKQKTLEMLKILLDKKLDPNTTVAIVFWIKDYPDDTRSFDYPARYTLYEVASNWSYPEAVKLLKEHGMQESKLEGY